MLKDSRNLLWIAPLIVLLTVPLWKPFAVDFLRPERQKTETALESPRSAPNSGGSAMTGVTFQQSKNDTPEWMLTAARLNTTENNPIMHLDDVQANFFGRPGELEETHIKSNRASYNTVTSRITLQGEVLIRDVNGHSMQTESMEYIQADKKIQTTAPVTIQGSNISVRGNRLLYDTATGNYRLEGNVVCRIW